ncbi:MAG: HEAT repeat domain-containing protein [Ktedonobacterales bacterium]|nr:HEAT repeat domain-containing protein [Ktedonobacterales bacterium]
MSRRKSKDGGSGATRWLATALVWLLILLASLAGERVALRPICHALRHGAPTLSASQLLVLGQVILLPLFGAVLAYLGAGFVIRLFRIARYTRALHRYTGQYLQRHAPLYQLGIMPSVLRFDSDGQPESGEAEPFLRLAATSQRMLVLGQAGAGKTVALHILAYDMTRRRWLLPLVFGKRPLPVLVSLPGYAQAPGEARPGTLRTTYCAAQLRRFGGAGLARQFGYLLRGGRVVLLCDALDLVPEEERAQVCVELATVGSPSLPDGRLVIACALHAYTHAPQAFGPLRRFQRTTLTEITSAEAMPVLRRAAAHASSKTRSERFDLPAHRLATAAALPATLAALCALLWDGRGLPFGRAQLLHAYAERLCQEADTGPTDQAAHLATKRATMLAALAGSLRQAGQSAVPLLKGQRVGGAVATWLATYEPVVANDHRSAVAAHYSADEADAICRAAIRTGILVVRADGRAISFAHHLLEDTFAAWWLSLSDDGLGRLHADLLRPRWALPIIFWASTATDPADVAKRLLRLVDTPDSTAARAGLMSRAGVLSAALALSLAAAVESFTVALAQPPAAGMPPARPLELAHQHLRDLVDRAYVFTAQSDQQSRLARALQAVEEASGPELTASIAWLARHAPLNRLLRAQLVGLLGMLASPLALTALTDLLAEMDPVMRQAVGQAFKMAGVAALPPLQAALANGSEVVRARAGEVLAGLGEMALENAIQGLSAESAEERVASAQAIGILQAPQAVEELVARLEDSESVVRVAAARALGQIGGDDARAALGQRVHSPDPALRAAIATALGATRNAGAVPPLLTLLGDAEAEVRAAAAMALGLLGDERAVDALQERRQDADPWAQHAAQTALRRMGKV